MYTFEDAVAFVDKAILERGEDWKYPTLPQRAFAEAVVAWPTATEWTMDDDAVSPSCRYAKAELTDGRWRSTFEPACVVGHVAYQIGALDQLTETVGPAGQTALIREFDAQALHFLTTMQMQQDRGVAWGEARDKAVAEVKANWG